MTDEDAILALVAAGVETRYRFAIEELGDTLFGAHNAVNIELEDLISAIRSVARDVIDRLDREYTGH